MEKRAKNEGNGIEKETKRNENRKENLRRVSIIRVIARVVDDDSDFERSPDHDNDAAAEHVRTEDAASTLHV